MEIRFGQDLAAAFAQVADELHSQYLISFAPAQTRRQIARHQITSQRGGNETASAQELRRAEAVAASPKPLDERLRSRPPRPALISINVHSNRYSRL